ncbi:MAG TPA: 50S ribosomal protein L23 [Dehalococcoidia bacterium]|nr:50S ribosomal protein L23 [Dehalococcoidia bacterium]
MPKPIDPYQVLVRPLITEKGTLLSSLNKYPFEVHPGANKIQIKHAVELAFNVRVHSVNTLTVHGKVKRSGRKRLPALQKNWKKAIVTLEPGEKIELFAGV